MARKSGWQQFADNFESVYGTFNKLGQRIETAKLMDDDEFTKPGGLGYDSAAKTALTGDALETARMKALGDIYTKYGNAKDGLEVRSQLAGLASTKTANELARENLAVQKAIRDQLIIQQGSGATNLQSSTAGLNNARKNQIEKLLPGQVDELEANNSILSSSAQYQRGVTPSKILKDVTANQVEARAAANDLSNADLTATLVDQNLLNDITAAQTQGDVNTLQALQQSALLNFTKRYRDGEFATRTDATNAWLGMVGAFDPAKRDELDLKFDKNEIESLATTAMRYETEMKSLIQKNDFAGIKTYLDKENGDKFGITLTQGEGDNAGQVRLIETNEAGEEVRVILEAANQVDAREQLEALSTYGNAVTYAELLATRKKDKSGIAESESRTALNTANAAAIQSATGLDGKKLDKLTAEIAKINAEVANSNLTDAAAIREKGYQKFLIDPTYALMQSAEPEQAASMLAAYRYNTGMLNMEALRQGGVTLEAYLSMDSVDRAAFER